MELGGLRGSSQVQPKKHNLIHFQRQQERPLSALPSVSSDFEACERLETYLFCSRTYLFEARS